MIDLAISQRPRKLQRDKPSLLAIVSTFLCNTLPSVTSSILSVGDNPNLAAEVVKSTDDVNKEYSSLREAVRGRSAELENALGESSQVEKCKVSRMRIRHVFSLVFHFQFFERLKSLTDQLSNIRKSATSLPPVMIEPDKVKERIGKVKVCQLFKSS